MYTLAVPIQHGVCTVLQELGELVAHKLDSIMENKTQEGLNRLKEMQARIKRLTWSLEEANSRIEG